MRPLILKMELSARRLRRRAGRGPALARSRTTTTSSPPTRSRCSSSAGVHAMGRVVLRGHGAALAGCPTARRQADERDPEGRLLEDADARRPGPSRRSPRSSNTEIGDAQGRRTAPRSIAHGGRAASPQALTRLGLVDEYRLNVAPDRARRRPSPVRRAREAAARRTPPFASGSRARTPTRAADGSRADGTSDGAGEVERQVWICSRRPVCCSGPSPPATRCSCTRSTPTPRSCATSRPGR